MNISTRVHGNVTVLTLKGRMDATNSGEFENACRTAVEQGCIQMVIDLSGLDYVSSAGLRAVIITYKLCHAQQIPLCFCAVQPMVAEVLKVCGLDAVLDIRPHLNDILE